MIWALNHDVNISLEMCGDAELRVADEKTVEVKEETARIVNGRRFVSDTVDVVCNVQDGVRKQFY